MKKVKTKGIRRKPYNRFDHIDHQLNLIDDGEHHASYLVSLRLSRNDYIDFINSADFKKIIPSHSGYSKQYNIDKDVVCEIEEYCTREDSINCEKEFKEGNEESIFEFCRTHVLAFRYNWVLSQIEKWKREKSKESLKKLKRLFSEYSKSTGKTEANELRKLIRTDKKIYKDYLALGRKNRSYDEKLKILSDKHWGGIRFGVETIREIIRNWKKIDQNIRETKSNLRFCLCGFSGKFPSPETVDKVVNEELVDIEGIKREFDIYISIRKQFGVEFSDNSVRKRIINKVGTPKKLIKIIEKTAKKEKMPVSKVKSLYKDFRSLEATVNHENFNEVIINEGLK